MAARLPAIWSVDAEDLVHTHRCASATEPMTEYFPSARTAADLVEHLARPDSHENHRGPTRIKPCPNCVGNMAEIEGASK